jgi:hypothetical protein
LLRTHSLCPREALAFTCWSSFSETEQTWNIKPPTGYRPYKELARVRTEKKLLNIRTIFPSLYPDDRYSPGLHSITYKMTLMLAVSAVRTSNLTWVMSFP